MAALFESDSQKMSERIRQAEMLLIARQREIFGQNTMHTELTALERAFYALRALRLFLPNERRDSPRIRRGIIA